MRVITLQRLLYQHCEAQISKAYGEDVHLSPDDLKAKTDDTVRSLGYAGPLDELFYKDLLTAEQACYLAWYSIQYMDKVPLHSCTKHVRIIPLSWFVIQQNTYEHRWGLYADQELSVALCIMLSFSFDYVQHEVANALNDTEDSADCDEYLRRFYVDSVRDCTDAYVRPRLNRLKAIFAKNPSIVIYWNPSYAVKHKSCELIGRR